MAGNKTRYTNASVARYIASRAGDAQRADCKALMALFRKITRQRPRMFGPSMVGYGSMPYTTAGGRSSDIPMAAFAIRGPDLVVYLSAESEKQKALVRKVGRHTMGKTCLYFRRLADLDTSVLEKLVVGSIAEVRRLHR